MDTSADLASGDSSDAALRTPGVERLSLRGTQILGPDGNAIKLRGWNWGQWEATQPQDGADNAQQGATVVRMPLRWWGQYSDKPNTPAEQKIDSRDDASPGHIEPHHVTQLDADIQNAINAKLWVILFLDSDCGQASLSNDTVAFCGADANGNPSNFANDPATFQKFLEVWDFLANRYKDYPYIAMYEAMPEPQYSCTGCDKKALAVPIYQQIIAHIRAIDSRTPILVGPNGGYQVDQLSDATVIPNTPNLVYTADFLNGGSGKPEKVALLSSFATAHNVPVFVQQVGSLKAQGDPPGVYTLRDARAKTILDTLNQAGIGWTWWTYREAHNPNGEGFAPYYTADGVTWHLDQDWLTTLTAEF
jgi:hypothetical protein